MSTQTVISHPFTDLLAQAIKDGDDEDHRYISISSVGQCREHARLLLTDTPFSDSPDKSKARHGTWLHEAILRRLKQAQPDLLVDLPEHPLHLRVKLPSGSELPGRPDLIDPNEPSVTDLKTVDDEADLAYVAKHGPTDQQRYQRHLYYAAALQAGLVGEAGLVRNVWLARTGSPEFVVDEEPFDPAMIGWADEWVTDVAYAVEHDEPASKDKPYVWCAACCPFFTVCRENDVPDAEILDPNIVAAVDAYKAAKQQMKELDLIAKGAAAIIPQGVFARVGGFTVKSTWVNGTHVEYDRDGYWRLDVRQGK